MARPSLSRSATERGAKVARDPARGGGAGRARGPPDPCRPGLAPRPIGSQHGDGETVLEDHVTVGADPAQKLDIGGTTTQEDVLAVVVVQTAALERPRRAPQSGP